MKQKKDKQNKPKSKFFIIIVGIVIIAFIALMLADLLKPPIPIENKIVTKTEVYKFSKEGELTFQNKNGDFVDTIDIEFADNDNERATGLMYRDEMSENHGMLFIFPYESIQSFFMRNTIISLDILYINSDLEIVTIHKNTKPFSLESLPSSSPAQYVVEVIAGYTEKYKISEGDKVIFRKSN